MFDLANQSFQLLIKSLLFSLYVTDVVAATTDQGKALWTAMSATSMLCVALLSPLCGAIADRNAWRREMLLFSGLICSVLTALLFVVRPGDVALCFGLYLAAAVSCGLGEVFLGAFLPEISTQQNIGYVSAVGWTMSYVGALLLLAITSVYAMVLGYQNPADFRPMFVFSGLWFMGGMMPAFLWLHERSPPTAAPSSAVAGTLVKDLVQNLIAVGHYRQLMWFFMNFFIYNMGTLAVMNFLSIIGNELGFKLADLLLFGVVMSVSAGVAAACVARFQDQVGHKQTIITFLTLWLATMLGIAGSQYFEAPSWTFWGLSCLVGLALGGTGTATRAIVGAMTPAHRSAEFFGLWGLVGQLSGILGVIAFGGVSLVVGQVAALLLLAVFFGIGILLVWGVDLSQGTRQAREAESARGIPDLPNGSG